MSDNRNAIFTELMPPSGGLEKLRRRLEQESVHSRKQWHYLVAAAASLLLCLALLTRIGTLYISGEKNPMDQFLSQLKAEHNPAMIRLGLTDPPKEAVTVPVDQRSRMAVQHVVVSEPDVIYYRLDVLNSMVEEKETDF